MAKRKAPAAKSAPPTLADATATKPPAARQYAAPKHLPRAKGGGSPSWTVGDGATLDAVARLRTLFEADAKQLACDNANDEDLAKAVSYWLGYPIWLEQVGYWWAGDETRHAAYNALNKVHHRATEMLMVVAERQDIDSAPLMESANWCRQLLAEPEIYRATGEIWPACLEGSRDALPPGAWEAAQKGYATLARLSVKIGPVTPQTISLDESAAEGKAPAEADEVGGGVAPRNAKFLEWYESKGSNTYHSHAKIRDKWNSMTKEQRAAICKVACGIVTRDGVIQDVKRAKKARGESRLKTRKKTATKKAKRT